jgi:hypothetical protein
MHARTWMLYARCTAIAMHGMRRCCVYQSMSTHAVLARRRSCLPIVLIELAFQIFSPTSTCILAHFCQRLACSRAAYAARHACNPMDAFDDDFDSVAARGDLAALKRLLGSFDVPPDDCFGHHRMAMSAAIRNGSLALVEFLVSLPLPGLAVVDWQALVEDDAGTRGDVAVHSVSAPHARCGSMGCRTAQDAT